MENKPTYLEKLIQDTINTKLSYYQYLIIFLCFCIALLDGFDTQAVAFTGPAIIEAFKLAPTALAPVLTAGVIGMTVGAMLLGIIGDRLGRRKTLLLCTLIFSVSTLLTAFATELNHIFILRIVAGLGMGGATPVLLALASEYSPNQKKGITTTIVLLALPLGAVFGGLLAAKILPIWGWQSIYFIGGIVPLILLVVLFFILPESLQYLSQRANSENLSKIQKILSKITKQPVMLNNDLVTKDTGTSIIPNSSSLSNLFQNGLATKTLSIWGTYFFNWVAWFMFLSWVPTILKQAGLAASQAPYASVTVNAGFILFALPLAYYMPKINVTKILYFMFFCGILIAISLGLIIGSQQWGIIFFLIALAGFGVGGQQLVLNYLVVATYPTEVKATASGWAIGMGRFGAIIGSAIGGSVLAAFGTNGYFFSLILPLVLSWLCVLIINKK